MPQPNQHETYLGDGVYARFDGYYIWLWAERDGQKHEIAIEPEVLNSLVGYVERLKQAAGS